MASQESSCHGGFHFTKPFHEFTDEHAKQLATLPQPHIESFNYMIEIGLEDAVSKIPTIEAVLNDGTPIQLWTEDARIAFPTRTDAALETRLFPNEAREAGTTYAGPLMVTYCRRVGDGPVERYQRRMGDAPIMVRSVRCHLHGMSPSELVKHKEEASEFGGYFICNGKERIIRMLQLPRRNFAMAITRSSYTKRGPLYSTKGVSIRCARSDQSSITNTLHYLTDGTCTLRFSLRKQEFFIPVMMVLKCFKACTDREVFEKIMGGNGQNSFLSDRVEIMLHDFKHYALLTQSDCLAYIGSRFRYLLNLPTSLTDAQAGKLLLDRYVLVHLENDNDKFELMVIMLRKLYAFVAGEIAEDNADSLANQELLLSGHLYLIFLKEKIEESLVSLQSQIMREQRVRPETNVKDFDYFKKSIDRTADIGTKLYSLLSTGNLVSSTGLDMMQVSGYTIVADKINHLRFLTHFRSVHRGQFFTEMKTTAVRKLLPESWGFLCPVHTPDGSPCGLLNHLTAPARLVTYPVSTSKVESVLIELGMVPTTHLGVFIPHDQLPVLLDGRLIGCIAPDLAKGAVEALRKFKANAFLAERHGKQEAIPSTLEVSYFPAPADVTLDKSGEKRVVTPFSGLFLASTPARLIRPVRQIATGKVEFIGPMEQLNMDIAVRGDDVYQIPGLSSSRHPYTHVELSSTSMLSLAASLTPFSDMNQSPRNMYQCQMGKQTMGTPLLSFVHRTDSKLYRIQTPQSPIVRNANQYTYGMDAYPAGTNAIVAVIAYTGYDMEDAMIINKSAFERGFAHGSVYKTQIIDLTERNNQAFFGINPAEQEQSTSLDGDGLPPIGLFVQEGDALYSYVDGMTGATTIGRHKVSEPAYIDEVRILGGTKDGRVQRVSIKLRFNRNPVVGDKFSSRHGQKGVLSMLWPQVDMPFTESGMSPDVIINPHAFPSRMTIGMLIESMAGKAGCLHGQFQDATPFRFNEKNRAVDYFGEQLRAAGYSYYGSEPLYSGVTGEELHADIYIGVVYYQRLRHMVSDKSQVRATGPINQLTRQPVKGRKNHGGIRFGEMERDSLISHGASFLLHDRLMNSSDRSVGVVCKDCGSIISSWLTPTLKFSAASTQYSTCRSCGSDNVCSILLPYVYRYLTNELAGMNIRLTVEVK